MLKPIEKQGQKTAEGLSNPDLQERRQAALCLGGSAQGDGADRHPLGEPPTQSQGAQEAAGTQANQAGGCPQFPSPKEGRGWGLPGKSGGARARRFLENRYNLPSYGAGNQGPAKQCPGSAEARGKAHSNSTPAWHRHQGRSTEKGHTAVAPVVAASPCDQPCAPFYRKGN